jgi:hypothetical protein
MVTINAYEISPDKPVQVGPFTVRLFHDYGPENPWESWDCQTPVMYAGGRDSLTVHDSGDGIADFFGRVSPAWVSRHWRKVCDLLDVSPVAHDEDAREAVAAYGGGLSDARRDWFAEYMEGTTPGYGVSTSRYLEMLAELYTLAGVPVLSTTVRGYSQGDWLDVLLVATPEHAARCGYDYKRPGFDVAKSLESDAELLRAWAFGDVYGYAVKGPDGETVDSCSGFYGCYFDGDPNGGGYVLAQAAEAVEHAARGAIETARTTATKARAEYLALRADWKKAQARAGEFAAGPLCKALARQARVTAREWRQARRLQAQCAAVLAG